MGTLLEGSGVVPTWWTDGYSLRLAGDGLSGPLGSPPAITVDGMAMPFEFLDRIQFGALPVSALDIDSMMWSPGTRSVAGLPPTAGVLSISTVVPEGTSFRGSVVLVNDTGDPGPDQYRSGGRNVDRSGPRASLRASRNEGPWFVEAAFDMDEHHMTDERIARRIRSVFDKPVPPVIRVFHPHARARYESGAHLVDVRAGRMTSDDFLFMDPIAREWPNRQTWTYLTGRSRWKIDPSWTAETNVVLRRARIESRDVGVRGLFPLSFGLGSAHALLRRQYETGSTVLAAGVRSESALQDARFDRVVETRAFAELGYDRRLSGSTSIALDARVAHPVDTALDPGAASSRGAVTVRRDVHAATVSAGASVTSEARPPLSSMSELVAAGFNFGTLSSPFEPSDRRTRARHTDLFVYLADGGPQARATRSGVVPWIDLRLRQSQGLTLPESRIGLLPDLIRFTTLDREYTAGAYGRTWLVSGGLRIGSSVGKRQAAGSSRGALFRLNARIRGVLSGSETFRNRVSGLPAYEVHAELRWSGTGRFGAGLTTRFEGPRTWRMYVNRQLSERPVQTRVDASVWKRLGGDSTLLTFGIRNLLDTPYRVHPAGIDEQLSVRAGMTVSFDRRSP